MPSRAYNAALEATRAHHRKKQGGTFSGAFLFKDHRHRVAELARRYGATSMLDYGCGWGKQYDMHDAVTGKTLVDMLGFDPVKYDPGVPRFEREPEGTFDLVVCVQVLGCVPLVDLEWVVDRLYGYANKAIFVAERIGEPRKQLFAHMREQMPHLVPDQWLEHLRRPGSPVRLILATRDKSDTGKWTIAEPGDQG